MAVLASGGIDSCALVGDLARRHTVHPLYIACGLAWEQEEQSALDRFLTVLDAPAVRPVTVLPAPVAALYGRRWSVTGLGVPAAGTSDAAVQLPGRNLLLLTVAAVWCSLNGVEDIAIGTLADNPMPDGSPAFIQEYARCLSTGLAPHRISLSAPLADMAKEEVIAQFQELPLNEALTCMAPTHNAAGMLLHCGACNKCSERRDAFQRAGIADATRYATDPEARA
ncbi:7-cyano-7-deazaguanine synthase [Streptomyces solincola]|uniref:7-cyano-7-deazaguanine synthase n=1 Tax=Streptomyces solincola TaxID=2100817 RepID=UPI0015E38D84|nr:7-cyano-7-deazaguanine synthase [Streptomyces solincola]